MQEVLPHLGVVLLYLLSHTCHHGACLTCPLGSSRASVWQALCFAQEALHTTTSCARSSAKTVPSAGQTVRPRSGVFPVWPLLVDADESLRVVLSGTMYCKVCCNTLPVVPCNT